MLWWYDSFRKNTIVKWALCIFKVHKKMFKTPFEDSVEIAYKMPYQSHKRGRRGRRGAWRAEALEGWPVRSRPMVCVL